MKVLLHSTQDYNWSNMQIWAVGGGKGGTGKSLVANGLGVRLAERGLQVILVDVDFGGANQHTYCGIRRPAKSLAQFFENKVGLEDLILDTKLGGLRLIPGNFNSPNTDGLTSTQKLKLFRHLKRLKADHVILDLGAGTQYDTLDTFLLGDVQVAVIAPDALSIENFYLFVKNLQYRQLSAVLSEVHMKDVAKDIWKNRVEHGLSTVQDLIERMRSESDEFSELMTRQQQRLRLSIILNQVREYRQVEMGLAVKSAVTKFFHMMADFAGYVRYDKELWQVFGQNAPPSQRGISFGLEQDLEGVTGGILKARGLEGS
jgi:flagellar biosynthesis protein FlhG